MARGGTASDTMDLNEAVPRCPEWMAPTARPSWTRHGKVGSAFSVVPHCCSAAIRTIHYLLEMNDLAKMQYHQNMPCTGGYGLWVMPAVNEANRLNSARWKLLVPRIFIPLEYFPRSWFNAVWLEKPLQSPRAVKLGDL